MTTFTIKNVTVVSESLLSQTTTEPTNFSIIKAFIKETNEIVYFVDSHDIGVNTVIECEKLKSLMFINDYTIIDKQPYIHDKTFINELLQRMKQ